MAEINNVIAEASQDLQTIEDFVNLPAGSEVRPRLLPSVDVGTLAGTRDAIFKAGGLPAEPFATKATMEIEGASLADGQLAMVYNETANNGLYVKTEGTWIKSAYDPFLAISDLDKQIFGVVATSYTPDFTLTEGHITPDGRFNNGTVGYQYSSPFIVPRGNYLNFDAYGSGICTILKTDAIGSAGIAIEVKNGADGVKEYVSKYFDEDTYVAVSSKTSAGALNLTVSTKYIKSLDEKLASNKTELNEKIEDVSYYVKPKQAVTANQEVGAFIWTAVTDISSPLVPAREIEVKEGDVVYFKYKPIEGTILWDWWGDIAGADSPNRGWALLTTSEYSDIVKEYTYITPTDMTLRISSVESGSIRVNGSIPITIKDLGSWSAYQVPFKLASAGYIRTEPFEIKKGFKIVVTKSALAAVSIVRKMTDSDVYMSVVGGSANQNPPRSREWLADKDSTIMVSGMAGSEFYITRDGESIEDKLEKLASNDLTVPSAIELPPKEFVFATAMNYILKTEIIEGVDYIKISQDLGKTWTQMPNILGDISSYHFFSDGTIMLCSPQKVYWTTDYLTLNEATVYDHDGSIFIPTSRHFFCMQMGDKVDFIGDQEIYAWGDYHIDDSAVRIWYSVDNGRTIKCAARFGVTDMGGIIRSVRHIHRVYYHAKTNYFYVTTGDFGDQNMIIRGRYDVLTDTWAWEVLNSGIDYKFGNIMIDDDNIAFMITDYTEASQAEKKGIYRVHASNLGDFSKYRMIYKAEPSEWGNIAPTVLLLDNNGNKILQPDYNGAGFIWLAREGLDFKKVSVSPSILLAYCIGENYNGDIWCVEYEGGYNLRLNSGSYNITKALRDAGLSNFMRGSNLITGLKTVVS